MSNQSRLVILGAGGHGKVVAETALSAGFEIIGFLDDNRDKHRKKILGIPVLGGTELIKDLIERNLVDYGIVAIGNNIIRAKLYYKLLEIGIEPATIVHPASYIAKGTSIGRGTVIFAGAIVQPGSIIGDNVIVNTGASIDHDNKILHHSCINPQATLAGGVKVGYYSTIHTNATITPYVKIGNNSVIGAGSVILKDVGDNEIVVGVPGRLLKYNNYRPDKLLIKNLFNQAYHTVVFDESYEEDENGN